MNPSDLKRLRIFVPGTPRPQGSKRPIRHKHTGRILMVEQVAGLGEWRARVSLAAELAMGGRAPKDGCLSLCATFAFSRPKSHYRCGRNAHLLRPDAPPAPNGTPDLSKLVRAVEDALTGIAFADDARIVLLQASKVYGSPPGAVLTIEPAGLTCAERDALREIAPLDSSPSVG